MRFVVAILLFCCVCFAQPGGPVTGPTVLPQCSATMTTNCTPKSDSSGTYVPAVSGASIADGCADAGSSDAYACDLSPAIAAYSTGKHYWFKANTANTGAATVAFNSITPAAAIKKVVGGITTALNDNDIRAGQWVSLTWDGTNMQCLNCLGNRTNAPLQSADIPNNAADTSGKATTAGNADTVTNGVYTTGAGTVFLAPNGSAAGLTGLTASQIPAIPLSIAATTHTMVAPREVFLCTTATACSVTLPVPAAGYEFCVRSDNNVSTAITLAGITDVLYEKTDRTGWLTAGKGTVSTAAVSNQICVVGYDATHYAVMSSVGTWTEAP